MKTLKGKIVLITGGGSGLGRLFSLRFASEGSVVIVIDIREDLLNETIHLVKQTGAEAFGFVCDLSNRLMIYEVAEKIKARFRKVDVLVNNAGIVQGKSFLELTDAQIQKTMDVNIMAHMWLAKVFLPDMIKANEGHIVTIASAAGLVGVNGLADYCASKFAAVGFDESIRLELQQQGISGVHTTCVCPGYIDTGMFSGVKPPFLSPLLKPEYVVDQVMHAVKADKAAVWLPRVVLLVPLLRAVLPVWLFDLFGRLLGVNRAMTSFHGRGSDWANLELKKTT